MVCKDKHRLKLSGGCRENPKDENGLALKEGDEVISYNLIAGGETLDQIRRNNYRGIRGVRCVIVKMRGVYYTKRVDAESMTGLGSGDKVVKVEEETKV